MDQTHFSQNGYFAWAAAREIWNFRLDIDLHTDIYYLSFY